MGSWARKRVLVTGAGGFIGSHLAERLVEVGTRVRALVHYRSDNAGGWLDQSRYRNEFEIVLGDVRDAESVHRAVRDTHIVFHLAALIGIPYSYHAPMSYIRTNIEGTANVLRAALESGVERVVQTSTSEVYGTAARVPIDEHHPLQGQSPYSASKIGADKMAEAFHRSFGLPVVVVRPFNTFGPRQSVRAIIPTIISQCLKTNAVSLGNLNPTRDFNFVTDIVDGFLKAAMVPEALGQTFNLGSGREISIGDLAHLIARLMGKTISVKADVQRVRPLSSEVGRLIADSTKARAMLGWEPRISLEEGLEQTISWLQENRGKYRFDAYAV